MIFSFLRSDSIPPSLLCERAVSAHAKRSRPARTPLSVVLRIAPLPGSLRPAGILVEARASGQHAPTRPANLPHAAGARRTQEIEWLAAVSSTVAALRPLAIF